MSDRDLILRATTRGSTVGASSTGRVGHQGRIMNNKHAPHALPLPEDWHHAIEAWLDSRITAGQPYTSVNSYRNDLQHLARRVPAGVGPWVLTPDQLEAYARAQDWAPSTRRRRRQTLLNFYTWAQAKHHVDGANVAREGLGKVKQPKPRPRPAPDAVYQAALASAPERERLMLRLAAEMGMRRGEVACVHTRDLIDTGGGWSLDIHGKGDKDRVLPLPASLAQTLLNLPRGYAFPGGRGGHLSPEWTGKLLARLIPEGWTMHTLRHRFATRAHRKYNDLMVVKELLGHESVATTQLYVLPDTERYRAMIEDLAS